MDFGDFGVTHSLMTREDGAGSAELVGEGAEWARGGASPSTAFEASTEVPGWVLGTLPESDLGWRCEEDGWASRVVRGPVHDLISVSRSEVGGLSAETFQQVATSVYQRVAERVATQRCHPVRLWNFIPGILEPLGDLPHRYMVFNAGRLEGLKHWLQQTDEGLWRSLATATGVGTQGDTLVVHCLAAEHPGIPVENPRQCPAYRYSQRYGPRPPCFARATRIEATPSGRPWLLVGGTASVLGEDTAHGDDLGRQIDETFANLAALVEASETNDARAPGDPLARFRHLRVYHPRGEDAELIRRRIAESFPRLEACEMQQATLCRPDLRVEIEGLVE